MKRSWQSMFAVVLSIAVLMLAGCPQPPAVVPESGTTETEPGTTETEPGTTETEPITPVTAEEEAKMGIKTEPFGQADGTDVELYTLSNDNGLKVEIMTYGATITAVEVPDRDGKIENVTLRRDSLDDHLAENPYFGSTVGRCANRIAKGKFTLDGTEYTLATNDGANHLHGGVKGFDKVVWTAEPIEAEGSVGVKFSYTSPDGEEGYPGTLSAAVTYSLNNDNELKMDYTATTDKPTICNLTNHCYWNLGPAAAGGILDHQMMINADGFLPVDDGLISLGTVDPVKDTPMDFTEPKAIGSRIDQVEGGYDHCYVLNRTPEEEMCLVAKIVAPDSGRVMEIFTTEPAVQFYTGNFLDGTITTGGVTYEKNHAFCLETQHYPDSPNQPDFPTTVLRPGETYRHTTVHKFATQ